MTDDVTISSEFVVTRSGDIVGTRCYAHRSYDEALSEWQHQVNESDSGDFVRLDAVSTVTILNHREPK